MMVQVGDAYIGHSAWTSVDRIKQVLLDSIVRGTQCSDQVEFLQPYILPYPKYLVTLSHESHTLLGFLRIDTYSQFKIFHKISKYIFYHFI